MSCFWHHHLTRLLQAHHRFPTTRSEHRFHSLNGCYPSWYWNSWIHRCSLVHSFRSHGHLCVTLEHLRPLWETSESFFCFPCPRMRVSSGIIHAWEGNHHQWWLHTQSAPIGQWFQSGSCLFPPDLKFASIPLVGGQWALTRLKKLRTPIG